MGDVISYEEFTKFQKEKEEMKEVEKNLKDIGKLILEIGVYKVSSKK